MTLAKMRFAPLALSALLMSPMVAQAGTFDWTSATGVTVSGNWTCGYIAGVYTCESTTDVLAPNGLTGSRERTTTLQNGSGTTTVTGTRLSGRSFSRQGHWTR